MLNKIKGLRIQAMKDRADGRLAKEAYTAVLSSLDYARGNQVELNDSFIMGVIKKEIKIFRESSSSNPQILLDYEEKAKILEKLLPVQLTEEYLAEQLLEFKGELSPKAFMDFLDSKGFAGSYNKSIAAKMARK